MKSHRAALVQHLEKIACGGQVTEAVFSEGFATQALTPDHLLLVLAPSLPGIEPLEEEIGMADLGTIIKSFGMAAGEGNEAADVDLRVEDHRLVIDEEHRAVIKLMTASPKTIGTRVEDATVKKLMAKAPTAKGISLTRGLIDGIKNTFSGFKVQEVELFVGPKGGMIRVGNENGHFAEFPSKALKAKEEYSLLFGEALVDVLAQVTDFSSAELRLGGPGNFIVVQDGDYQYLLSPKSRGADEKKPAAKAAKPKKEKAAAADADEEE